MPRVKRGVTARAKHKKVFEFTKGHRGRRKNVYRVATQSMDKALQYAYRDRRNKKEILEDSGSKELMRVLENMVSHMPSLLMD